MTDQSRAEIVKVVTRITALRRKVRTGRKNGRSINTLTTFDFDILDKSLELLCSMIEAPNAFGPNNSDLE